MVSRGFGRLGFGGEERALGEAAAEGSGDVEGVVGAGGGAAEGGAAGDGAEADDVGEDVRRGGLGSVASCERAVAGGGEGEEAVEEAVEPARVTGGFSGKSEGQEGGDRAGSHGGEVAQASCEGAVAGGPGRVPGAGPVAAFEAEVCGDDEVFAHTGLEDGTVVADAEQEFGGRREAGGSAADAVDEGQLACGLSCGELGAGRHSCFRIERSG